MKVLIIDLVNTYEYLYRRKFSQIKADLDFTSKLTDIDKKLTKKSYDLLLIGHNLKNSSGLEAYTKVRNLGYTGDVIIMSPGNNLKQIKSNYENITGVMSKITNTEDFILELNKLIEKPAGDVYVPTT
jgi:response regulator of citrate/malate metabolism